MQNNGVHIAHGHEFVALVRKQWIALHLATGMNQAAEEVVRVASTRLGVPSDESRTVDGDRELTLYETVQHVLHDPLALFISVVKK